jgi:PGF-CTERM protein
MKFITVDLIGNELGTHKIDAEVHYSVLGGDDVLTQHEMLTLTVIDASMKEQGTTPEQGSSGSTTPGFEAIVVIAALFAGVYLVGRKR